MAEKTVITSAHHAKIAKALGRDRGFESSDELIAAFEAQQRELATTTRRLESAERSSLSEVAALRRDLEERDREARKAEARRRFAEEDAHEHDAQLAADLRIPIGELI